MSFFVGYDLIHANISLELAWMNNMIYFAFPHQPIWLQVIVCNMSFWCSLINIFLFIE